METRISQLGIALLFVLFISAVKVNATGNEAIASGHENIEEATLELENWMTDESTWSTSGFNYCAVEQEVSLEIEPWMTNELSWSTNQLVFEEIERELEVESWMIDENNWKY